MSDPTHPVLLGLLRRRTCLLPTWRGWLALTLIFLLAAVLTVRAVFPFLAVNDPKPGGVLIAEGWMPDYALREAIAEFRAGAYRELVVTGGPIDKGAPFSEFGTYAELGAATVIELGLDAEKVRAIPAPIARQDRTFLSAVAVRNWWREHGGMPAQINVVSLGPHARRTRMLYRAAFAGSTEVGMISIADREYDGRRWWRSSAGFRTVTGEVIAYLYARLLFRPPAGE